MTLEFVLNGTRRTVQADPGESLMDLLRRLGFKSVKNGCDDGYCGACAVLLDGRAVNACLVFAARAAGSRVDTVEGVGREGVLHPVQRAALDLGAIQCGFCTPGIVMTALDLLAHNPRPDEAEVREALAGNYCRCTGYVKPVEAILAAAAEMREAPE
ncbi:MAG: (2Fe-2S)-binding protein [Acidimicrobiia bacterium]|nr:(2Fe-2S)-binding protein [Acidimicrobiia bacterium]